MWWLDATRQQTIIWTKTDHCRHTASLDHNEFHEWAHIQATIVAAVVLVVVPIAAVVAAAIAAAAAAAADDDDDDMLPICYFCR